jgi:hypothetical protein
MSGKNKGGREVRKPKQAKKPKGLDPNATLMSKIEQTPKPRPGK